MTILAIDTAANLCAAGLYDAAGNELGREVRDIGKGHAESLMDVIATAMDRAGRDYADLSGVAVSVGPGSFTGVRIGVAAARGIALARAIPSTGVTTLEAIAFEARMLAPGRPVTVAIDARRDEVYVATYAPDGSVDAAPALMALAVATRSVGQGQLLAGSGAPLVASQSSPREMVLADRATADIASFAAIALARGMRGERPRPLYLRNADARPQSGFALPRVAS